MYFNFRQKLINLTGPCPKIWYVESVNPSDHNPDILTMNKFQALSDMELGFCVVCSCNVAVLIFVGLLQIRVVKHIRNCYWIYHATLATASFGTTFKLSEETLTCLVVAGTFILYVSAPAVLLPAVPVFENVALALLFLSYSGLSRSVRGFPSGTANLLLDASSCEITLLQISAVCVQILRGIAFSILLYVGFEKRSCFMECGLTAVPVICTFLLPFLHYLILQETRAQIESRFLTINDSPTRSSAILGTSMHVVSIELVSRACLFLLQSFPTMPLVILYQLFIGEQCLSNLLEQLVGWAWYEQYPVGHILWSMFLVELASISTCVLFYKREGDEMDVFEALDRESLSKHSGKWLSPTLLRQCCFRGFWMSESTIKRISESHDENLSERRMDDGNINNV
jgi:hypothetical protein